MVNDIVLEDIVLDDEALGLAESLLEIENPFSVIISSDEEAEVGDLVFFGVDLSIGDIGEVKGKVKSCEEIEDELYAIEIEIKALDNRYTEILSLTLRGDSSYEREGHGIQWATGLRQTNGMLATLINSPGGLLNVNQLSKITELAKLGHGQIKLTHAQRVILLLKPEQLETIEPELAQVGLRIGVLHTGIRNIRGCCGALCQFSQNTDGLALSLEIDKALFGRPMKYDVKIAVSDCLRNCMESFCVDIGLIANKGEYSVYVGGAASSVHFKGLKLAEGITPEEVIPIIEKILDWYDSKAKDGERLYKTIERLGIAEAKSLDEGSFAKAAMVFQDESIKENLATNLQRLLSRSCTVKQMKIDLGLVP